MKVIVLCVLACLYSGTALCDEEIAIDAAAAHHRFPHFWEQMFGSGRAILSLRDSYRRDLRAVKQVTGLEFVRFHDILDDDIGVYEVDARGNPQYNFTYVDEIYDGLLAEGVKPFVELSFMPRALAAQRALHSFKYHPIVSPPRDYAKWDALVAAFAGHLIERYGINEVSQWYFEVWNEPNIDFWTGTPAQSTYFTLYDHTANALKLVNDQLRVGGPATAQAAWIEALIQHTEEQRIPLDFVSTHVYANDTAQHVFGTQEKLARSEMVCRAAQKVHDEVSASARPDLPIIWSEYNASYLNEPKITDSVFMGPWLANTIRRCDGLTEMMAYWTFSDVFDEQGVAHQPFYGGYGLVAAGGIPKPAFNAFKLLHQLGEERLDLDSDHALLTRRRDGALVLALWNYVEPGRSGAPSSVSLKLPPGTRSARMTRLDSDHGDVAHEYARMGSPKFPTRAQIEGMIKESALSAPEELTVSNDGTSVTLAPSALAIIEIMPAAKEATPPPKDAAPAPK